MEIKSWRRKNINWPVGVGAKGNEGVTSLISKTDGAIGYVELAYAISSKLNTAAVKNKSNEYITASEGSISKAAAHLNDFSGDMKNNVINAEGKGVYPISSFSWILVPENNSPKTKLVKEFLIWSLKDGQKFAGELH